MEAIFSPLIDVRDAPDRFSSSYLPPHFFFFRFNRVEKIRSGLFNLLLLEGPVQNFPSLSLRGRKHSFLPLPPLWGPPVVHLHVSCIFSPCESEGYIFLLPPPIPANDSGSRRPLLSLAFPLPWLPPKGLAYKNPPDCKTLFAFSDFSRTPFQGAHFCPLLSTHLLFFPGGDAYPLRLTAFTVFFFFFFPAALGSPHTPLLMLLIVH